jgi:hypothetical protein
MQIYHSTSTLNQTGNRKKEKEKKALSVDDLQLQNSTSKIQIHSTCRSRQGELGQRMGSAT